MLGTQLWKLAPSLWNTWAGVCTTQIPWEGLTCRKENGAPCAEADRQQQVLWLGADAEPGGSPL